MEKRDLSRFSGSLSVVMGFHGCVQEVSERVINRGAHLRTNANLHITFETQHGQCCHACLHQVVNILAPCPIISIDR